MGWRSPWQRGWRNVSLGSPFHFRKHGHQDLCVIAEPLPAGSVQVEPSAPVPTRGGFGNSLPGWFLPNRKHSC